MEATSVVNANDAFTAPYGDHEEPYPSLSDYHDYEPNLEFDDTELQHATSIGDLDDKEETLHYLESPVSDGTIEENFEEELGDAPCGGVVTGQEALGYPFLRDVEEDYGDISKYGIVEVVGDDTYGRKVIVVSACKLPSNKELNHARFLRYLMSTLDRFVEQDYSLVYFHYGLNSKNKPPLSWLWQAYKAFDRKYKKNLKALYLVHPTKFIRVLWRIFTPAISVKFGKKVMYVNYLHELKQHLSLDQLCIPQPVIEHDRDLMAANSKLPSSQSATFHTPIDTQQFGVSLQFIKDHNDGEVIPPVLRQCVECLSHPDALETEGIFRRSANITLVKELRQRLNTGETIDFGGDFHLAAVMMKTFLRELEEPIMTYDLFEEIIEFQAIPKDERPLMVKNIIMEKMPEDNYLVLKYIMRFLSKVTDRCDLNKMTSSNLAVVFGPNLVWSQNRQLSLAAIGPINMFTDYMLSHQDEIFIM